MTSRPVSGGPANSPGFLLWHASLRWQALITSRLAEVQLTVAQFAVLAGALWLSREGGTPMQREVAEHAGTDPMMTSQLLRLLEKRRLLTRRPNPEDGRARRIVMTEAGKQTALKAIGIVREVDEELFFKRVGDVEALRSNLRNIMASASALADEGRSQ